jgi:hypothetical protein
MKTFFRVILISAVAVTAALADTDFSFTGTFTTDDQVQLFDVTLTSTATDVIFQSLGYAGGTNAAGNTVVPGGFDTFFTWYDSSGNQIGTDDDGLNNGGCVDVGSFNGACLDAYFTGTLTPGDYTLALTESGNFPNGNYSDGFSEQGMGNFTASGTCLVFCDAFGNTDTAAWAVDIDNVASAAPEAAPAPEPSAIALMIAGLSLLVLARPRRKTTR